MNTFSDFVSRPPSSDGDQLFLKLFQDGIGTQEDS